MEEKAQHLFLMVAEASKQLEVGTLLVEELV